MRRLLPLLLVLLPRVVAGQDACVIDSSKALRTLRGVVAIRPATDTANRAASADVAQLVAQELRGTFRKPEALGIRHWTGVVFPDDDRLQAPNGPMLGSGSTLSLVLSRDGRLRTVELPAQSTIPVLVRRLEAAAYAADSAGAFSGLPLGGRDSARVLVEIGLFALTPAASVPLFVFALPVLDATEPVEVISRPTPKYPTKGSSNGIESVVDMSFIVDRSGRPRPETITILDSKFREFEESAIESVRNSRFKPAMVQGCPVEIEVEQRVRFSLTR